MNTSASKTERCRIEYRNVTKIFATQGKSNINIDRSGNITAVKDILLSINDGEVVSLIGPSGCGKSTLLNMGAGLYQPTSGDVFVDGERVDSPNSHVAFMLQKDLLLPWRSIRENVEVGLEIRKVPVKERRACSTKFLEKTHLKGFEDHYPHQLSGGMRQRAALARTLAVDPTVLLMDEPFSALDAQTKMVLQQDLAQSLADEHKTALLITHDLSEAVALSDRIVVMSARPGSIIKEFTVDIPNREKPLDRRHTYQQKMAVYIAELMELLHLGDTAEDIAV